MAYSGGRQRGWRQPPPPGWALQPAATPEQEAAARREAELSELRARIARRERLLTVLLTRLAPFEHRYQREMGARYARLFELFTLIDEERKRRAAQAEEAAWAAIAAGARSSSRVLEPSANGKGPAGESLDDRAAGDGLGGLRGPSIPGPIDRPVRRLFRKLARQIHPDLVADPQERARRTELMAAANRAYASGDAEALQRLLEEWEQSPGSVQGSGPEADLARLERRVVQAAKRLSAIEEELRSLARSPMLRLYRDAAAAGRRGRDLLADMGDELNRLIERTERDVELVRAGILM